MQKIIGHSLAALLVGMTTVALAAGLDSGLKVGEAAGPFDVKDITGPKKGTTLCYR